MTTNEIVAFAARIKPWSSLASPSLISVIDVLTSRLCDQFRLPTSLIHEASDHICNGVNRLLPTFQD